MAISVKEKTGPQVQPGTHLAVCYRVVDLGTQPDSGFGVKEKIVVFWELPHERITIDGQEKPMGVSKFYTKSLGKRAALRKDLEAWRGKPFSAEELAGFDMAAVLGKGCQLQIVDNNGKSQIAAVVGLPKGTTLPPPFNPSFEWSVTDGKNENWVKLPDWVKEMAAECLEWTQPEAKAATTTEPPPGDDTDIPF